MSKINGTRLRGKALFLFLLLLLFGCAAERAARTDPFFEKWDTMASEAKGHSPAPRPRLTIMPEAAAPEGASEAAAKEEPAMGAPPGKGLPTGPITLKMRQADVKAVVRALARAAGINILIKNDVKGDISVNFANVPWDQAFNSILNAQGLSYAMDGDIIRIISLEDMEQSAKIRAIKEKQKMQAIERRKVEPLVTMVVNVDYADPEALRENLLEFLTKDKEGKAAVGSVKVDKHSNALIIQAIRDDINRMIPIIEKIDRPIHQINIKANIVETTKEVARSLGIQWGGMFGTGVGNKNLFITPGGINGATSASPLAGGFDPTSVNTGIAGQGFASNFPASGILDAATAAAASGSLGLIFGTIGGSVLEVQLNALQQDNKLNILSSPSITTLDNQKAFTENGERIPVVSQTQLAGTQVRFEDAVLRLEITPHVIDEKNLKMKILVKKDEVDLTRQVQGNPFIIKKQTETTLIVQDGETIVISGLSKQTATNAEAGVPWLKEIPVLGWLFKNMGDKDQMQEVLIFITPKILPPQVAAATGQDKAKPAGK